MFASQAIRQLTDENIKPVYFAKSIGLLSILVAQWLLHWLVYRQPPVEIVSVVIVVALLPNAAVALWPRHAPRALIVVSVITDIVCATAGIHFSGGIEVTSGPLLYGLEIGLAGLILPSPAAYLAAGGSGLAYGLMVWLEHIGTLARWVPTTRLPERQAAVVVMVVAYLFLMAVLVSYAVRRMRAFYRQAEELRSEAVHALSHDLRDPLGIIYAYAQMIAEGGAPESDCVRGIQRSARTALDLVQNVLDAAVLEDHAIPLSRTPVRLNELVTQVFQLYRPAAAARGLELTTQLNPELPIIEADPQLLVRAIGNLVSNAIKYTDSHGTVELSTALNNGDCVVAVRDSGCGISPFEQARLFQKYGRTQSARVVEGTGLGLYIVRRISEAHGGTANVVSVPDEGSTFSIHLPVNQT